MHILHLYLYLFLPSIIPTAKLLTSVAIQTYIAKLKSTISDLETEVAKAKNGDEDDAHAHYHGHEKCTADHGHDDVDHENDEKGCDEHEGHSHGVS